MLEVLRTAIGDLETAEEEDALLERQIDVSRRIMEVADPSRIPDLYELLHSDKFLVARNSC